MFDGCINLLYAPKVLPAQNLIGNYCYQYMFRGCKSLVNAPELPAEALGVGSYQYMFINCTSLKTIRCRAKVKANNATLNWLDGVNTVGTFYGHSEYGWSSGRSGIPTTWTFEELTD